MLALPSVLPDVEHRSFTRIGRDLYERFGTCDYSVHPRAIRRRAELKADFDWAVTASGDEVAPYRRAMLRIARSPPPRTPVPDADSRNRFVMTTQRRSTSTSRSARRAHTPSPRTATSSGCCSSSPTADQQGTQCASTRGPRSRTRQRVPRALGDRAKPTRTDPQRAPCRIYSQFRFAALRHPDHAGLIQRVLAIPEALDRALVSFLTADELDALLAALDCTRWPGRRDHALLLVATQTGLRVYEFTSLSCCDVVLGVGAHVRCTGKGRKERVTPRTSKPPPC
jgi:integrase